MMFVWVALVAAVAAPVQHAAPVADPLAARCEAATGMMSDTQNPRLVFDDAALEIPVRLDGVWNSMGEGPPATPPPALVAAFLSGGGASGLGCPAVRAIMRRRNVRSGAEEVAQARAGDGKDRIMAFSLPVVSADGNEALGIFFRRTSWGGHGARRLLFAAQARRDLAAGQPARAGGAPGRPVTGLRPLVRASIQELQGHYWTAPLE